MSGEKKDEIRVEDRRHFDREGNVVRPETEAASGKKNSREARKPADSPAPGEPENIDFSSVLFSYIHVALISLGEREDPIQKKASENLEQARQMIDILDLMQQKTKGNLTEQESQYLESALYDLRMRYMKKSTLLK